MAPTDQSETDQESTDQGGEEPRPKLNMEVKIDSRSACQRHITVTIPHEEVERYYGEAFSELMGKAAVPGFRPGRAPRKLVEVRYRKDVTDQVKGSLLMDSVGQISEGHALSPISEPDFDPKAIVVPDEGPMTFEFDIEVRPEFDVPNWKGLKIDRPTRDFTDADVDTQLQNLLAQHGQLVPHDGPASTGDYVTADVIFRDGDQEISKLEEQTIRIRSMLSFRDGKVEGFDTLMEGVKAGESRTGQSHITQDAPNVALRGKTLSAEFRVHEVKKLELPKLTPAFLDQLGGFDSEEELREAIRESLERRMAYTQRQRAREQVLASLTVAADWDLPPDLLLRQSRRELERSILELRRSGFSESEIRSHGNELTQNSRQSTARALKEHFVLERIAEEEKVADEPDDYDHEIELIAQQSGETPRRIRAQLEKRNLMDTLRNQIIERKILDLILSHAVFKDVAYKPEAVESEAIDRAAGGGDAEEIPEAHHDEGTSPDQPTQRGEGRK
jgi:trigger factor